MNRFQEPKTYQGLTNKPQAFLKILLTHKVGLVVTILGIVFVSGSLGVRETFMKSLSFDKQGVSFNNYSPLPTDSPFPSPSLANSPSPSDSPSDNSVLGVSTETSTDVAPPLPSFSPIPTPSPIPSYSPTPTVNSTPPSCSGTPNADNSQVYVSPSSTTTGSSSTITVDLQDCNNSFVSSDDLTISLSSGDTSTTINGSSIGSGYHAQAQNGQYTFKVSSSNPTTAVFSIQDTTHNFQVTTPGYHNPQVTFSTDSTNSSCTPDGDAYYSNAYFPSGSVTLDSNATITIDLRDCNNQATLGSDTVTVTPKSVDSSFQFVGYGSGSFTLPQGQKSFQVTSQNPGTDTFTIRDTTQGFDITGPHYSTPSVTFVNATSSPSPSPSATSSPSPSDSSSSSPSPSPTDSSSPSASSTSSPSPSSSASSSPSSSTGG